MRIAMMGGSGAGKTTLGKELARRLDAIFVEVDAIQHKANWERATVNEIRQAIHSALDGRSKWVIDRTCDREVGDFISSRADILIWMDLPLAVKLARLFRRSWKRVRTREVLWNGNVERWSDVFVGRKAVLVHPLRTHFRQRRRILARPDQEKIVRLRSADEIDKFVSTI